MKYSVDELRDLWPVFHGKIHEESPDMECPGECSYVENFLDWLAYQERIYTTTLERLKGPNLFAGPVCPRCGWVLLPALLGAHEVRYCGACGVNVLHRR